MKKLFTAAAAIMILTACASKSDVVSSVPATGYKSEIEAYKLQEAGERKPSASLWTDVGRNGNLFLDAKARNIGDIVIVRIVETSSASNSSSSDTSRSTNYQAGITDFMGLPLNMGASNFMASGNSFSPTIGANTANTYSGQGSTTKSDKVSATIAARIIDILPSGNLVIEGNREIIIDQEKQTISLQGIVRQNDIDSANTVASTAIADAKITYTGSGATSSAIKKGWLGKAVDVIWPF